MLSSDHFEQKLIKQLEKLNNKLNKFLAVSYLGAGFNEEKYAQWKLSHQPFHWFAEFYQIMHKGGFDVVIGNPPYVEYNKTSYALKGYSTIDCGNLYAYVVERNENISSALACTGMIIPHSAFCTDRMAPLMKLFLKGAKWISSYDIRPSKLFNGVDQRLSIYILHQASPNCLNTTRYHRWVEEYRKHLFSVIEYGVDLRYVYENAIVKAGSSTDIQILCKISSNRELAFSLNGHKCIYYHNAPRYWIRAMSYIPYFWNEKNGKQTSSQIKTIAVEDDYSSLLVLSALCSNLFYWWFLLFSDSRHLNFREINRFRLDILKIKKEIAHQIVELATVLESDFKKNKLRKEAFYQATGKIKYDEYFPKHSKPIIDQIDTLLAKHYGFTAEELDYIINYDIKYRMGSELEGESDA